VAWFYLHCFDFWKIQFDYDINNVLIQPIGISRTWFNRILMIWTDEAVQVIECLPLKKTEKKILTIQETRENQMAFLEYRQ
jgi:hypothetical protein